MASITTELDRLIERWTSDADGAREGAKQLRWLRWKLVENRAIWRAHMRAQNEEEQRRQEERR